MFERFFDAWTRILFVLTLASALLDVPLCFIWHVTVAHFSWHVCASAILIPSSFIINRCLCQHWRKMNLPKRLPATSTHVACSQLCGLQLAFLMQQFFANNVAVKLCQCVAECGCLREQMCAWCDNLISIVMSDVSWLSDVFSFDPTSSNWVFFKSESGGHFDQ